MHDDRSFCMTVDGDYLQKKRLRNEVVKITLLLLDRIFHGRQVDRWTRDTVDWISGEAVNRCIDERVDGCSRGMVGWCIGSRDHWKSGCTCKRSTGRIGVWFNSAGVAMPIVSTGWTVHV